MQGNKPLWTVTSALCIFAVLFCASALSAPFWNDNDTWSNLLPIIQFKHSILKEHTLPLFTDLWYGGRAQWANPLWSFFYLPSTLVWLMTPLDWGARIVFQSHFVFSLLAARALAGLFLQKELDQISASIILVSPVLPALTAGHIEKIMAWGWVLIALYFLFNQNLTQTQRGVGGGFCLGIIPLTGANYYTLYAAVLILPLVASYKERKLVLFVFFASLIGLLHLPSVWHMVGHARNHAKIYVEMYSLSPFSVVTSLATGISSPLSWETWAPVGVPVLYLFGVILLKKWQQKALAQKYWITRQDISLFVSMAGLFLLATGTAYQGHQLLDSFRVPSRALAFLALGISLFVFLNVKSMNAAKLLRQDYISLLIFISAVQVAASAWSIRPQGSTHSPYEESVQRMADVLKADQAKSVWFSSQELDVMYIHVGLMRNGISLPVVYYGDMGQAIAIEGQHCGYSFDHLLTFDAMEGGVYELNSNLEWSNTRGTIGMQSLHLIERLPMDGKIMSIYRVVCN